MHWHVIMYETNCTSPHFCNLLQMVYKEAPFAAQAQPLDSSPLSCAGLLNKLAFWKLWCPLSLFLSPPTTVTKTPLLGTNFLCYLVFLCCDKYRKK
jgi:hypothetical protein